MTWKISKGSLDEKSLLLNESLFALGNGYLGVRGNFEEGYQQGNNSIRGTYINAFHDETEISYGEKLHAFPDTQQKLVNIIDSQDVTIFIDGELFSLFSGKVMEYEQNLHFDGGYSERIIRWLSPNGKEVKLHFRRMVSFVLKELFLIDIKVEPVTPVNEIKIVSSVNGDVSNYIDKNDPRVASGHAKRLFVKEAGMQAEYSIVRNQTMVTNLEVACVTDSTVAASDYQYNSETSESGVKEIYTCNGNKPVQFTKFNVYTDTLRHQEKLVETGLGILQKIKGAVFEDFIVEQTAYLTNFWNNSDVTISGDQALQEGIRFNLFHLLQSVGKDPVSNIAAKGLSGEGYEGHYFWDTEIYMFPVFLMTNPDLAKNLLVQRYSTLDSARLRAKEMGHSKGALFPWRTITGTESSGFFPAGTAQYHISADIAYSYVQYFLATTDVSFLKDYMAEVLFETARLWMDTGHMYNGQFRIDNVTGPDEYTCIVNNNYYTNIMAKNNLNWAAKVYKLLEEVDSTLLDRMKAELSLNEEEVREWTEAAENMYLPYDEKLGINAQDDTFLQKNRWDLQATPKEKFPLLLNYHPLTLYRYQVCKQADTVLGHFLLEDEQNLETIKKSYDYYEQVTTHDSSLSYCIFSIMASKLGYTEKAYDYFMKTARLDLDNTHGNTKDGLHMANMGGTWMAIVYGFAGLRLKETGLSFAPFLPPKKWETASFNVQFQNRLLSVTMEKDAISYWLKAGEALTFRHFDQAITLQTGEEIKISTDSEEHDRSLAIV
ncbi:glycoside hydrolase family 65 protein [Sediminibacillus albus]|uniref:Alpha,alpha-trehalose phosphorylase n=1 Tax=Sediminibacillus albus TaxID=407036 RepID=A0A1G8Y5J6_9BACI|nr:glycosyl hydrolase family 65 protein [Sediminibacillus albus]SDJ98076.1 alpha,alpha-trehalose phosphorylase [Sediminibacillus albus]